MCKVPAGGILLGGGAFGIEMETTLLQILSHPLPALSIKPASTHTIAFDYVQAFRHALDRTIAVTKLASV